MLKLRHRSTERDTDATPPLGACVKHSFDRACATCRSCRDPFCPDCLVYPFGFSKAPLCVSCALVAAGVRR